jgi:hemerythrin-like domain-containing protein
MTTIGDYLTQHHRECDELYASAEQLVSGGDWDAAGRRATRFRGSLERHFRMEEEVLFPAFEEATGMSGGPTAVMRGEHVQARDLLARMEAALEARDARAWLSAGETLHLLLQQHDMKEEGMLYPMADNALAPDAAPIVDRMSLIREG